ncbi:MAG: TIGR00730 family Rossman fold protein, partial [Cypionkella sp.]
LEQHQVKATVVVFGSARFIPRQQAEKMFADASTELTLYPNAEDLQQQLKIAERQLKNSSYYEAAAEFSRIVTEHSKSCPEASLMIISGGGPGVMEAANKGAYEAGGQSIGLNIVLPHEQKPNPYITPEFCFRFHYFAIRKMHFLMRAQVICIFPGGFGTLDEMFESLTLIQTGRMSRVPFILFGSAWWNKVINWQALADAGVIAQQDLDLFQIVDTAEQAMAAIDAWPKGQV